jgi:hypothetical protein
MTAMSPAGDLSSEQKRQLELGSSLEASGASTFHATGTGTATQHASIPMTVMTGSPNLNSSANYLGNDASYDNSSPGARLKPIPRDRLKYQKYVVYGEQQQQQDVVEDGLNSSQLSFEDASRLHSSAIAMETATIQVCICPVKSTEERYETRERDTRTH